MKLRDDISQGDLIKLSILAAEGRDDAVGVSCVLFDINYAFLASVSDFFCGEKCE